MADERQPGNSNREKHRLILIITLKSLIYNRRCLRHLCMDDRAEPLYCTCIDDH